MLAWVGVALPTPNAILVRKNVTVSKQRRVSPREAAAQLMHDPRKRGPLKLPMPDTRTSEDLIAHGPVHVHATPSEEQGPTSPRAKSESRGSRSGAVWIQVPNAPGLASDVTEIWHYTDTVGLVGILESGSLRAGSLATMNDSAEYSYGRELLDRILTEVHESAHIHPIQKAHIDRVVTLSDALSEAPGLFALSASTSGHSLAQWRAYGGGYPHAIVLSTKAPLGVVSDGRVPHTVSSLPHEWRAVLYDRPSQTDLLLAVLGFVAHTAPRTPAGATEPSEAERSTAMTLVNAISYCKEPSFSEEQEVRMVVQAPSLEAIHFRPGRTGITPFVCLASADSRGVRTVAKPGRLPLNGVVIGPFAAREASAQGASLLLSKLGYDAVEVTTSTSTLR